jgi:acetyl esterase/lipase
MKKNGYTARRPGLIAAIYIGAIAAGSHSILAAVSTPVEVFGRLPAVEDMILSPDGSKLAFVETSGDKRSVLVFSLEQREQPLGAFRVGETKLRDLSWLDNDNLLITRSSTEPPPFGLFGASKSEWFQLATYRVSTHELLAMDFRQRDDRVLDAIAGTPMLRDVEGAPTLFVRAYYLADRTLPGLFKYSVKERRMTLVAKSSEPSMRWVLDETGQTAAEFVYRAAEKQWRLSARKDAHMQLAASGQAELDIPSPVGFSANGDALIMDFLENGEHVWKPLLLKDASWGAPIDKNLTFRRVILDRKSSRIVGGAVNADEPIKFLDAEIQAHWDAVHRAFPNEIVDLVSHSDDYSKFIVRVFGARDGYVYALFDWYTHKASVLAHVYQGLTVNDVRKITYPAADGLAISAFLTMPNGVPDKNLPLIVLPHGGPAARDSDRFDWWSQGLAAQGYAVLQPNYRGSNLTQELLEAGYGQWGRKMQTDLSDGVRYLAKQGTIDPTRVCIVGASYGGYAALAGVSLDPGIYRCAVSVSGPADLKLLLRWTDFRAGTSENLAHRYWDRFMGLSSPNDPAINVISPIEHVSAVTVPVMLIHGRDDTVVPYEQSEVMFGALKRANKPVQMVTLDHEDHWLSSSATRLQMLEASVAFLKANNPPN